MTDETGATKLWDQVLDRLRSDLPPALFGAYVKSGRVLELTEQTLKLAVSNEFQKQRLLGSLSAKIGALLEELAGRPLRLECVVDPGSVPPVPSGDDPAPARAAAGPRRLLNPKYRLENYVVGETNRFPYLASLAVVKGLGTTYNPFFLWGPVGVGKTHLMQAVGHQVLDLGPDRRVMYVTAENFINEWFEAIHEGNTKDFQVKYRTVDLLLLDDVQFFEKKETMQEAFFHTFNELYQKQHQIVLTSDRPPKQLEKLQERIVSRFESGLTAEIRPPDLETRFLILTRLAQSQGVDFPRESLHRLAEVVTSSIRELEGGFTRITAYSSLLSVPITTSLVEEILKEFAPRSTRIALDIDLVIETVAGFYQLEIEDLKARRQTRTITRPRQVAMFLMHELLGKTLKEIALVFGKKDHTTVLYACDKVRRELKTTSPLAEDVKLIRIKIKELTRSEPA